MKFILVFAAFLVAGAFLTGCGSGSGSRGVTGLDTPVTTRSQYGPLALALTLPKTIYQKGEAVPITFSVTNTSSNPVSATVAAVKNDLRVEGDHFSLTTFGGQIGAFNLDEFAPGETKTETLDLALVDQAGRAAGKGDYKISARYVLEQVHEDTQEPISPRSSGNGSPLSPPPLIVTVR